MGVAEGAAAVAIAGTALNIYGQISGAAARKGAAEKDAYHKRLQADELLSRQAINEQIIREQSEKAGLRYGSAFASTGREGAGIGGILEIKEAAEESIKNSRRDAEFKASMLRIGADIDTQLASDMMTAGYFSAGGTLLSSGADIYGKYDRYESKGSSEKGLYK